MTIEQVCPQLAKYADMELGQYLNALATDSRSRKWAPFILPTHGYKKMHVSKRQLIKALGYYQTNREWLGMVGKSDRGNLRDYSGLTCSIIIGQHRTECNLVYIKQLL